MPGTGSPPTAAPPKRSANGRRRMDGRCRLRPATAADVPAIAALERAVFSDPWSAESIRETIGMPWIFTHVAEESAGRILGYVFCREVAGESELLNIAVDPD